MDSREDAKRIRKKIDANYKKGVELLRERDIIARRMAYDGVTWEEMQHLLGLSPRGLRIVLDRTKED